jgi:predicted O-methyltransferase YrrM
LYVIKSTRKFKEKIVTPIMGPDLRSLLTELEAWGRRHDAGERDHSKRMLNLAPDTARLLGILVRSGHRTRLLEIGTSNGYSTIWLAWSAQATGGHVTSIDRNPEKVAAADANLRRAGLRDYVTLLHGDAVAVISTLPGPFDFVFFDADRTSAPSQLDLLFPKLAPDALVVADNAISHPQEIAGYLSAIKELPMFDHIIVPIGNGLSIAYKDLRSASHESMKETRLAP